MPYAPSQIDISLLPGHPEDQDILNYLTQARKLPLKSWAGQSQGMEGYPVSQAGGFGVGNSIFDNFAVGSQDQFGPEPQMPTPMDAQADQMYASVQQNPADQYMDLGRQMASEMANDYGPIDRAYELSVAARTGKNVGEVLNEQKARRINAMNALTAQVNSEIAYMNAERAQTNKDIEKYMFAANGDPNLAREIAIADMIRQSSGGSSEFERLMNDPTLSPEDRQRLIDSRRENLAGGGTTGMERIIPRMIDIRDKMIAGTATEQEVAEFDALNSKFGKIVPTETGVYSYPVVPRPGQGNGPVKSGVSGGQSTTDTGDGVPTASGVETVIGKPPKELDQETRDVFNQTEIAIRSLRDMAEANNKGTTGMGPKGWMAWLGAQTGLDQDALKFDTAWNQYRLAAQALIKGIPSNYDVQTVLDTLPSLTSPQSVNKSRIDFGLESFRILLELTIGYHAGRNVKIPKSVLRMASELGINIDDVPLYNADDVFEITKDLGRRAKAVKAGQPDPGFTNEDPADAIGPINPDEDVVIE